LKLSYFTSRLSLAQKKIQIQSDNKLLKKNTLIVNIMFNTKIKIKIVFLYNIALLYKHKLILKFGKLKKKTFLKTMVVHEFIYKHRMSDFKHAQFSRLINLLYRVSLPTIPFWTYGTLTIIMVVIFFLPHKGSKKCIVSRTADHYVL